MSKVSIAFTKTIFFYLLTEKDIWLIENEFLHTHSDPYDS